ncbi:MAG: Gfo/Idh/MocA family oxidoreductase [Mariniphaga sp.]
MDRRSFIQKASAGSAAMVTAVHFPSFAQYRKLKIGLIGAGWYGMVITKAALKVGGVEVIAICDVDTLHLSSSATEIETLQGSKPQVFKDYRDLLEVKGLEAVMIGTPPHWHALPFIAACEKGLHIYCEKPLSYDVMEGLAMVNAVGKAGNIVQIGFQRRQSAAFQKAKEVIEEGATGKIHQIGAQIHYTPVLEDHTIQDPPASLDWDAWCGPAPKLPYRPVIGHKAWRLEKEYGNGHLVDWGIHHIDIIRKIMDFGMPVSLDSQGGLVTLKGKITTPDTLTATIRFEECPVIWQHRMWGTGGLQPERNNGIFFYGEKATLFASDNKLVLMPAGKNQVQEEMNIPAPDAQERHVAGFLDAVRAKDKSLLSCTVDDAFKSTTAVHLAMASYYTGSRVNWDPRKLSVIDNPEAEKLLARPYRKGYRRPAF